MLLDDTHILTSSICETVNAPKISVINSRLTSLPKIIFLFPELLVEPHHYDVELNAAPSSLSTPLVPERNRSPTFTATSDKILTLTVFDGVSNNPVFIVPSWVLQKAIATIGREIHSPSEEDIVVPWEQWGPEGTAFFPTTRLSILESTLFSVSGMLYITEENGSIVLYDFNRFALRRDASLGTTENCTIESDPNKHECETFAEPFSASLPWRKFVTPLKVEPDVTIGIVDNSVLVYRGSGVRVSIQGLYFSAEAFCLGSRGRHNGGHFILDWLRGTSSWNNRLRHLLGGKSIPFDRRKSLSVSWNEYLLCMSIRHPYIIYVSVSRDARWSMRAIRCWIRVYHKRGVVEYSVRSATQRQLDSAGCDGVRLNLPLCTCFFTTTTISRTALTKTLAQASSFDPEESSVLLQY